MLRYVNCMIIYFLNINETITYGMFVGKRPVAHTANFQIKSLGGDNLIVGNTMHMLRVCWLCIFPLMGIV